VRYIAAEREAFSVPDVQVVARAEARSAANPSSLFEYTPLSGDMVLEGDAGIGGSDFPAVAEPAAHRLDEATPTWFRGGHAAEALMGQIRTIGPAQVDATLKELPPQSLGDEEWDGDACLAVS
jgi:hypothetical protein